MGTLRGTTDGHGNTSAVKVAGDLDLDGGNLAGVHTLSGAKDANNNPVPVTLADVGTLRGTTDGQGGTSAVKVAGNLDLDGGNLAGVRTLSGAKDANNNTVPLTLADVGTLRGTTDRHGNTSAVRVAGDLDLDGGNLTGVHTVSGAKDANNNPVPVTLADVGTLRGTTDGHGNTSAVKVAGDLDLDGGNLAGVRTLSGAKDANNNPVPVTLADVGTLRGTTDGHGNTSAVKVAGDLDLDGGNLAGVRTLSGAKDANNNPVPVTLADVGTLRGTTDGHGNTSAVKVAGDLDLDGGNLAGVRTLSGARDANNNPVPVTLADVGTLRGTTDGHGNTSAVKVAGDLDLDGGNLAGVRTLSGARDANNNPVPVTLADVGTLRGTTDGQGGTSAVKVAGGLTVMTGTITGSLNGTATKVAQTLEIKIDGQQKAVFDGSVAKSVDITTPTTATATKVANKLEIKVNGNEKAVFDGSAAESIDILEVLKGENVKTGRIIHNGPSIDLYPGRTDWNFQSGRSTQGAAVNVMDADLFVSKKVSCNGIDSSWTSDERFKRDIQELDGTQVLDALCRLRPVTYRYVERVPGNDDPDVVRWGLVAQEVQQHFPHIVDTIKHPPDTN